MRILQFLTLLALILPISFVLALLMAHEAHREPVAAFSRFDQQNPLPQPKLPEIKPVEYAKLHFAPIGTYPNSFPRSQCTYGAASMKGNITWRGNANSWDDQARARGIKVSTIPIVGAVAQSDRGSAGHVAVVAGVRPGQVLITERNYDYRGSDRTSWQSTERYVYIYI